MTKFVNIETEDEDVLFATFGKLKANQDKTKSLLIKEGDCLEGVVTQISDSKVYTKIYRLKVKGQDKPVVVLGKTDLNNKMGYGTKKANYQVQVNDLIQIVYKGIVNTGNGRPFNQFEVLVAK